MRICSRADAISFPPALWIADMGTAGRQFCGLRHSNPTAEWIANQVMEHGGWGTGSQLSHSVTGTGPMVRVLSADFINGIVTGRHRRTPQGQNGRYAERLIGSIPRRA